MLLCLDFALFPHADIFLAIHLNGWYDFYLFVLLLGTSHLPLINIYNLAIFWSLQAVICCALSAVNSILCIYCGGGLVFETFVSRPTGLVKEANITDICCAPKLKAAWWECFSSGVFHWLKFLSGNWISLLQLFHCCKLLLQWWENCESPTCFVCLFWLSSNISNW